MTEVLTDETGRQHQKPTVAVRKSCPFDWVGVFNYLSTLPSPDNIPPSIYRRMAEQDPTIGAVLQFIELTVASALGPYVNPKTKAQDYIEATWENCETSFTQAITEGLRGSLVYGVKFQELCLRPAGDMVWLDELPGLRAEDIMIEVDPDRTSRTYGRLVGVRQNQLQSEMIGRANLVVSTNLPEDSNHWGRSQLKSVYSDWVISTALKVGWGQAQEAYGSPPAVAYIKSGNSPEQGADGEDSTRNKNMLKVLTNLKAGACITADIDDKIELLQAKFPIGEDHERAQNHFDKKKMRGMMVPSLLFEPTEIGSLALGNKHWELFRCFANHLVDIRSGVILRQIYRPLLWMNFGTKIPIGKFLVQKREEEDQKLLSEIFFALTQSGYLSPRQLADYNAVRQKFDLEPAKELPPPPPEQKGKSQSSVGSIADNGRPSGEVAPGTEGTNTGAPRSAGRAPKGPQGRAAAGATLSLEHQLAAHSYASTQVDIPEPLRSQLMAWAAASIDPADLAEDGLEDDPHVTVRYGLVEPDPSIVGQVLANQPPGCMVIGGMSLFQHDGSPDVLKLDVHSADLCRLNRVLKNFRNVESYPVYAPHLTLAYLREGAGANYVGGAWALPIFCSGQEIRFDSVVLCDTEAQKQSLPLAGGAYAAAV